MKKFNPPVYTIMAGALIRASMKDASIDKKVDHQRGATVAQRVGANYLDGVGRLRTDHGVGRTTLRAKR